MDVLNATNAQVDIYMDDGSGAIEGAAVMSLTFRRAMAASGTITSEEILHAGSPVSETILGSSSNRLALERLVSGSTSALDLTDALYYIRVNVRTDNFGTRTRYDFKKCRRLSWDVRYPDVGPVASRAQFSFEDYAISDL